MQEIRNNPFRFLGIFANTTLKEQSAQVSQMKAYARVGQKVDNPLRLERLLGPLPADEEKIADSESLIALPNEREQYALFWFAHGPNPEEDLKAIEMLDRGMPKQAMAIWNRRDDREALQNLMVAQLLERNGRDALGIVQQLFQTPSHIRRFVLALKDFFGVKETPLLACVTNPSWVAVLKEMLTETYQKNIEDCLEAVKHKSDNATCEALFMASFDLDRLRDLLGSSNVTYVELANQMADALMSDQVSPLLIRNPAKWFDRAYEVAVDDEKKEWISVFAVSFYSDFVASLPPSDRKQLPPLGDYHGPIPKLREYVKEQKK